MKRTGKCFRDQIMSPGSRSKRLKLKLFLEELTKPEIDIPLVSQYTSMTMSKIQQQSITIIPQIIKYMQQENEPLVLEITKNKVGDEARPASKHVHQTLHKPKASRSVEGSVDFNKYGMEAQTPFVETTSETESTRTEIESLERSTGESQFEIIFSDSTRPTDADNDTHIIHSTTERTANTDETPGTVNVPNSFPLFQIVHTGEVPEDVQHEIVRLIRQANPELDLNSITFKFKSPETVEIIANVNS